MRRILVIAAIASAAVLTLAPASEARKLSCRPAGAKTIAATSQARVFRHRGLVYGCLYTRGVAVQMTTDDGYGQDFLSKPTPVLDGRFVGYAYSWEGAGDGGGDTVAVIDLRSGRATRSEYDSTMPRQPQGTVVKKLIVSPNGWIAWSWILDYGGGRHVTEIRKLRPGHGDYELKQKPLDSGDQVDPLSLVRTGLTIKWLHAYAQRTSKLS